MYPSPEVVRAAVERAAADCARLLEGIPGAVAVVCEPLPASPSCHCGHLPGEHRADRANRPCTRTGCGCLALDEHAGQVVDLRVSVRIRYEVEAPE